VTDDNPDEKPLRSNLRRRIEPGIQKKGRSGFRQLVTLPNRFIPRFWEDSDNRLAAVRLVRQRCERLKSHAGGDECVQRDLLCQRAAFLSIILETFEVEAAEGKGMDLAVYTQAVNSLQGLLKTLGLEKRIKSTHDLRSYLNGKKEV
jgi:hypothetical protein